MDQKQDASACANRISAMGSHMYSYSIWTLTHCAFASFARPHSDILPE
jgi:hypothetical protein